MRNQGWENTRNGPAHTRLGFNYRLSDIHCALGLAQLSRLEQMLAQRASVADLYGARLKNIAGVVLPPPAKEGRLSWCVYVVRLTDRYTRTDRDHVLRGLRDAGIGCSNYFQPIHLQPLYVERFGFQRGDFPVTERIADRTLALPFFNALTASQVDEVMDGLQWQLRLLGDRHGD